MTLKTLIKEIEKKQSLLSVGIDPILDLLPEKIKKTSDPLFTFGKYIVEATEKYAISFKLNTAFFEAYGKEGWAQMERLAEYIKVNYPNIFLIADAKRGDIAHSSKMYAKAFFSNMPFDAITVNPYMGRDAITPFLEYENKWVILLALTSNPSAWDIQLIQEIETRDYIFEKIFKYGSWWGTPEQVMFVAGATFAYKLQQIRHLVPNHFLLVPGIGAQGGNLSEVCFFGLNNNYGLIINSSRNIIYASQGDDFAEVAASKAYSLQQSIANEINNYRKVQKRRL